MLNLLVCDDESAGNSQFIIIYNLTSSQRYILVVTTYFWHTFGCYVITIQGPSEVPMSLRTSTTTTTSTTTSTTRSGE